MKLRLFLLLPLFIILNGLATHGQTRKYNLKMWGGEIGFNHSIDDPVVKVDAGYGYSLALLKDSTVACWGDNEYLQCSPPKGLKSVVDIAAGKNFSLALRRDGTVKVWGDTTFIRNSFAATLTDIVAIDAGAYHAVALKRDGTVVCWGSNQYPRVTSVPPNLENVKAVYACSTGTCALKTDGTAISWGDFGLRFINTSPTDTAIRSLALTQDFIVLLKNDSTVKVLTSDTSYRAPANLRGVVAVNTFKGVLFAQKQDGSLVQWGPGRFLRQADLLQNIHSMSCSITHALFLKSDSTVRGSDWIGGSILLDPPVGFYNLIDISLGYFSYTGLRLDSTVVCWPSLPGTDSLRKVVAIEEWGSFKLALKDDSTVYCWGASVPQFTLDSIAALRKVVAMSASPTTAMFLLADGTVRVAISGNYNYDAYGVRRIPPSLGKVVAIAAGNTYCMALNSNGRAIAWGNNFGAYWAPPRNHTVARIYTNPYYDDACIVRADGTKYSSRYGDYITPFPWNLSEVVSYYEESVEKFALLEDGTLHCTYPPNLSGTFSALDIYLAAGKAVVEGLPRGWKNRHRLIGKTFGARNTNCLQDSGERALPYQRIMAQDSSGRQYFGCTDQMGRFMMRVDSGVYRVFPVLRDDISGVQHQICPPAAQSYRADFAGPRDTVQGLDFALDSANSSLMQVSLVTNRRACSVNLTYVKYENPGASPHQGVVLHVRLPRWVTFKSASMPYTLEADSTYSFALGTVAPGASGMIVIQDSVACISLLRGLEQCTKAWLTSSPPSSPSNGFDGSYIQIRTHCLGQGIRFTLRNVGQDMRNPRRLRIYKYDSLGVETSYQLAAGDSISYTYATPNYNDVLTIQAGLDSLSPVGRWQLLSGSCNPFAPGLLGNKLVEPDGFVEAQDCQPIRYSYDPNDKQVQPAGLTAAGNVEPGTWLRYRIRFMNKGNDTAYTMRIVDTLSENIDIASLRFGASSHRYVPTLSGKGRPVLSFRFTDINLPDSTRSGGAASQGFVDFSVRTNPTAPLGTEIRNFAEIYFDYNDPVRTNTTLNTLYRPTVVPGLIDTLLVSAKPTRRAILRVEPNPAHTSLRVFGAGSQPLELLNAEGRRVLYQASPSGDTLLNIEPLPVGLYLLRQGSSSVRVIKE